MGSKADFYVGRGKDAEWLGSLAYDGLPAGLPRDVLEATSETDFRERIGRLISVRGDGVSADQGWPWEWSSSSKTKYAYAFDDGAVWASCFGSSWWLASDPEPDHTTLAFKAATFPRMKRR